MNLKVSLLPILLFSLFLLMSDTDAPTSRLQTNTNEPALNAGPDECSFAQDIPVVEDYLRLVTFSEPYQGKFDSGVTVIEYFDPNCPHCKTLHPIMKEVIAANSKNARFFMIPFVLWQYSLPQAEALFVAGQDGKYFEMLDAQYQIQQPGGLSLDQLVALSQDIGLDPVKFRPRLEKGLNQRMIMARREEIRDLGVQGTPALMNNGKFVDSGSKSLTCINQLIKEEVALVKKGK